MHTKKDTALANAGGEDERPRGLTPWAGHGERLQEGNDSVLGDGLQQPGRAGQRLQTRAQGRQEGANQDDPFVGPRDVGNHQFSTNTLTKPEKNDLK